MSGDEAPTRDFYALTPERILGAVESTAGEAGARRTTGRVTSLDSLENRVYDIELADADGEPGERVVAKFYRPGRWSEAEILEEHAFLAELRAAEVPAVAPLALDAAGATLHRFAGSETPIFFALFPKVRGRATEEPDHEQLEVLGRLVARLHAVGASRPARGRARLDVATYARRSCAIVEAAGLVPAPLRPAHHDATQRLVDAIEPVYATLAPCDQHLRVHGDCHHGNLLWDARGPFFLDFDDFTMGPAVQDLWLVAPGRDEDAQRRRAVLAEAYAEMRPFDARSLGLVEALRGLRILRYAGWIAARYDDPSFRRAFPDYAEESYWRREIAALVEQRQHV